MKRVAAAIVLSLAVGFTPAVASELSLEEALCLRRVVDYLEARDLGDPDADGEFYSKSSRIWFESKNGPGRERNFGKGPWADWDSFFNAEKVYLSFEVEGRTASVVLLENNDFYKLIDREPGKVRVTYEFDDAGYVTGTLVQGLREAPVADRLDEFKEWAKVTHPDELAYLMPDDRISPEIERAKVWKKLLVEWREEVGLPAID